MTEYRPIGVFDSGLGGLTAVKILREILPHEEIVYFGDTGRVPYGSRSPQTILKYTAQDIAFLRSKNVKMVVSACGTVSSVAGALGEALDIPFTGILLPASRAAAKATQNGRIGVIGTTATIRSGSFRRTLEEIAPDTQIFVQDCPLFVPLVENGFITDEEEVTRLVAQRYLAPLMEAGVDTLILGCTHYPIISRILSRVMGDGVTLIDSGRETALACRSILEENKLLDGRAEPGGCSFYVSDSTEGFAEIAGIFLGADVTENVEQININEY